MTDETNRESSEPQSDIAAEKPNQVAQPPEPEPATKPGLTWCIILAATNMEAKALNMLKRLTVEGIERVLVPTIAERKRSGRNTTKVVETKLYPGYIFAELMLNEDGTVPEDLWYAVKGVSGVRGFIGDHKPVPLSEKDAATMIAVAAQKEKRVQGPNFKPGDNVRVTGGSFEGHDGTVDKLDEKRGVVTVSLMIFGRSTPVEVEVWQVEKDI